MMTRRLPIVREFMDRYVETVSPEMDIMDAVDFLLEKRITGALVADSGNKLVGIITELDCLKLLTLGDAQYEAPRGKVKDFMVAEVQSIPATMDIYYCAGLFMNVSFRRFPVMEGDPGADAEHRRAHRRLQQDGGRPHRGRDYAFRPVARRAA